MAVLGFAVLSAYLALIIITRVDSLFLPGNQLTFDAVPGANRAAGLLPGVDDEGASGNQDRINILVLGIDRRPGEGVSTSRTDTIFVVTVDPKTKSTAILGIPRDLVVSIPGRSGGSYEDRINTVFVSGELNGYSQGGISLLKQVLADDNNLGIRIDKYVIVDFEGFETVIDALGGIDVDVPDEVSDPYYSETELPGDYLPQYFEEGLQHMDGQTALAYSRIRFSSDDLDRIQRQQRVIFATIDKAMSLDVLSNAPSLWSKYRDAVQTDISDLQIPGYARLASQVVDDIHTVSLGPATAPYRGSHGEAFLVMDKQVAREIIDSFFSNGATAPAGDSSPSPVLVEVQNGTEVDGLASRVVDYIASRGYPVNDLNASNAGDGFAHARTEIIDLDGSNRRNAFLLATWLQIPAERVRDATAEEQGYLSVGGAKIVIVLGTDDDFDTLIQSPTTSTPGG